MGDTERVYGHFVIAVLGSVAQDLNFVLYFHISMYKKQNIT